MVAARYEAEVDFMSMGEWQQNLKTMWHDLLDENGKPDVRAPDRVDTRTAAGAAQAQIQSVLGFNIFRCPPSSANSNPSFMLHGQQHLPSISEQ